MDTFISNTPAALSLAGEICDPSYLHPQESHDNGVDCTQKPLWVKRLCGVIHFLEKATWMSKVVLMVCDSNDQCVKKILLCMWGIDTCYHQTSICRRILLRLQCSLGKDRYHRFHQLPNTL